MPRIEGHHQKLGRGRKDCPPIGFKGAQPCWHLDFWALDSRISAVLSYPVCGTLLQRPLETSAGSLSYSCSQTLVGAGITCSSYWVECPQGLLQSHGSCLTLEIGSARGWMGLIPSLHITLYIVSVGFLTIISEELEFLNGDWLPQEQVFQETQVESGRTF